MHIGLSSQVRQSQNWLSKAERMHLAASIFLMAWTSPAFGSIEMWGLTSCTQDTAWTSARSSGAPIKSWIQSIVPTFDGLEDVHPRLGVHFVQIGTFVRPQLVVQDVSKAKSLAWKAFGHRPHDGWLYGELDLKEGVNGLSGPRVAYVYEDFQTVILGHFDANETLIKGSATKIRAYRCKGGLMELSFAKETSGDIFSYLGQNPLTMERSLTTEEMDPLDQTNTFVADSHLKDAGQGLFAKQNLQMGSMIALFYGQIIANVSQFLHGKPRKLQEKLHKNLLAFNATHAIDVPEPYDNLSYYRGSLGHKANHGFKNNARFGFVKSPRFGQTRCIEAVRNIARGEEILVNYGYNMNNFVPDWYKELYKRENGDFNRK